MRRPLLIVLMVLVFATLLFAAISRNFSQGQCTATGVCNTTTATTHTFTSATASNSNRLMLAFTTFQSNTEDTISVKFNTTESFTNQAGASIASTDFATVQTWYLVNPTATTANVIALTNSDWTSSIYVLGLSGVDTVSPIRDSDEEQTNSGTAMATGNLTLTTVSGDLVVSCIRTRDGNTGSDPGALSPNSGTEFDELFVNGVNERSSCAYQTASGSSVTVGWTWPNAIASYAHVAVAVTPSSTSMFTLLERRRRQ